MIPVLHSSPSGVADTSPATAVYCSHTSYWSPFTGSRCTMDHLKVLDLPRTRLALTSLTAWLSLLRELPQAASHVLLGCLLWEIRSPRTNALLELGHQRTGVVRTNFLLESVPPRTGLLWTHLSASQWVKNAQVTQCWVIHERDGHGCSYCWPACPHGSTWYGQYDTATDCNGHALPSQVARPAANAGPVSCQSMDEAHWDGSQPTQPSTDRKVTLHQPDPELTQTYRTGDRSTWRWNLSVHLQWRV